MRAGGGAASMAAPDPMEHAVDASTFYADGVHDHLAAVRAAVDPSSLMVSNLQVKPAG